MKKKSTEIRDIYRAKELPTEPELAPKISEAIEREIRYRVLFNLFVGVISLILVVILVVALVANFSAPKTAPVMERKSPALAGYSLPSDAQWVLDYQRVLYSLDSKETVGRKKLSARWVLNGAYNVIMGEQALHAAIPAAAQIYLETAAATFPSMTGINRYLGVVYIERQEFRRAVDVLEKAIGEQPDDANILNNLGVACMGVGDFKRAEQMLLKALSHQPDMAGCYKNLGLLYQKTSEPDKAVAALEKYFQMNPGDTAHLERYVTYLLQIGRGQDALRFLDRLDGANALTVHLLLARTAAQGNDAERAVVALTAAAEHLSPREVLVRMHEPAFEKVVRSEPFQKLAYKLEMEAVAPGTTGGIAKGGSVEK